MSGANEDGILFGTHIDTRAGSWSDEPINRALPYICERSDQ